MVRLLEDRDLALERAKIAHGEQGSEPILDAMAKQAAFAQARYNSTNRTTTRRENIILALAMGAYLGGLILLIAGASGATKAAGWGLLLTAISLTSFALFAAVVWWKIREDWRLITNEGVVGV